MLQLVRTHQGISRVELAALMSVAPSTIGIFVSRLLKENFLLENEVLRLKRGRPRTALSLNPGGGYLLGVDIEANRIRAVCLDFREEIQDSVSISIRPDADVEEVLKLARDAVLRILPKNRSRILGLGVAAPGSIDIKQRTSSFYKYIKGWENVQIGSFFEKNFNFPVYLESNMRAMASAELWFGQGRAADQFVSIVVRSGMGAGIVTQGKVCKGAHQSAGEIGFWLCPAAVLDRQVIKNIFRSNPAHIELEEIASVRAVLRNIATCIRDGQPSSLSECGLHITVNDLLEAYRKGDKMTVSHLNAAADGLGWAAGQINVLLDPGKIIFSSPFMALGQTFLDRIRRKATEHVRERHLSAPEIVASELGEFSGALGAAAQIVHHWVPVR